MYKLDRLFKYEKKKKNAAVSYLSEFVLFFSLEK